MTHAVIRTDARRPFGGDRDDHERGWCVAWGFQDRGVAEAAARSHGAGNDRGYAVVDDYDGPKTNRSNRAGGAR